MNEQELNAFLDLEWNCAAFTPEEASVSVPLSPKQWVRLSPRLDNFYEKIGVKTLVLLYPTVCRLQVPK